MKRLPLKWFRKALKYPVKTSNMADILETPIEQLSSKIKNDFARYD